MAQITVQKPVAQVVAFENVSAINYPVETGQSFADAAIVILNVDGTIQGAPANVANANLIAGIAQHASSSVMTSGTSSRDVFGYFQASPVVSNSNAEVIVVPLGDVPVEINLTASTGWITGGTQQAALGTRVGLAIDPTTGFYVADPTAANKVATITAKPNSVYTLTPTALTGVGNVGDLGARVDIVFDNSALALTVGH
jgi:hypothetical protein